MVLQIIIIVLLSITLIFSFINLIKKSNKGLEKTDFSGLYEQIKVLENSQLQMIKLYNENVSEKIISMGTLIEQSLKVMTEKISELSFKNEKQMEKLIIETRENLEKINKNNEKKLDEMRVVVDDKLSTTLNDRLSKSFAIVSEQLQAVTKGLGEMQSLANGVGDLKKVLTNVKTRGTFGEIQLGQLLEQMLAPSQYAEQVMINPSSAEKVDYAINLPGKDDNDLLLPIDAKFPIEDYIRLVEATEKGSIDEIAVCQKQLVRRIKEEAKSIKDKYIQVPKTTDFAIMYLPTEGLYAEVIKNTGLFELLQREYKITVCGPTTLSAFLNSLQMGFRTLAIEKRSGEIWSMLATFKKEFSVYVELLSKTQKKLNEASDTIENATKKSEKIQKQLSKVSDIDPDDQITGADGLLGN